MMKVNITKKDGNNVYREKMEAIKNVVVLIVTKSSIQPYIF